MKKFLILFLVAAVSVFAQDKKISAMTTAVGIDSADAIPIVQSGASKKILYSVLEAALFANSDTSAYTVAESDALLDSVANTGTPLSLIDNYLAEKQATLVSGTNIKTVNSTSLLGSGNIEISGSLTAAQLTAHEMMWEYLNLDTTATLDDIPAITGASVTTLTQSDTFGVGVNDVARAYVDSGAYNVKSNNVWSGWTTTAGYYKDIDSAMVRHYSSGSANTQTLQYLTIGGATDTFKVTTANTAAHVTDSLKLYWRYSDVSDGTITAGSTNDWADNITALEFSTVNGTPTKSASGIALDTAENFKVNSPTNILSTAYSIELVAKLVPNVGNSQVVFTMYDGSKYITMAFVNQYFSVRANDGTNTGANFDSTNFTGDGLYLHIVVTFDGDTIKAYTNGTERSVVTSDLLVLLNDGAVITVMGEEYGTGVSSNSGLKFVAIYNKELSQAEVTQNYNSFENEL